MLTVDGAWALIDMLMEDGWSRERAHSHVDDLMLSQDDADTEQWERYYMPRCGCVLPEHSCRTCRAYARKGGSDG